MSAVKISQRKSGATTVVRACLLTLALLSPGSFPVGQELAPEVPRANEVAELRGASADAPELATGFALQPAVRGHEFMAVTANPYASEVAYEILAAGGTVLDAAVAAQMVLNVVEPQSSGIGGGGFLLYFDAASGDVMAYDGRETAPAAADANYLRYASSESGNAAPQEQPQPPPQPQQLQQPQQRQQSQQQQQHQQHQQHQQQQQQQQQQQPARGDSAASHFSHAFGHSDGSHVDKRPPLSAAPALNEEPPVIAKSGRGEGARGGAGSHLDARSRLEEGFRLDEASRLAELSWPEEASGDDDVVPPEAKPRVKEGSGFEGRFPLDQAAGSPGNSVAEPFQELLNNDPRSRDGDYKVDNKSDSEAGASSNTPAPVVPNARQSGRAVGVPGLLRVLELAHKRHGRMEWSGLFSSAIELAREGFVVSPRMATSLADAAPMLKRDRDAVKLFIKHDGNPYAEGETWRSAELAQTLEAVASGGADAFYTGPIAEAIVAKVAQPPGGATPGRLTLDDLSEYQAVVREPVCTPYRRWEICGFPPPSSGGIAVAQIMAMLQSFDLSVMAPTPAVNGMSVHLIAEASRLAYADRNRYIADPDFVTFPLRSWRSLLEPQYLSTRARQIDLNASMSVAEPGLPLVRAGDDARMSLPETTHVSLVDAYGNALAMTTSIEGGFGSFMAAAGVLLNNQLTDFSPFPVSPTGVPVANRVEPGKRPRSSMAPTLVFERTPDGSRGPLTLVTGSPGGGAIIQYVVRNLVAILDWDLGTDQAAAMLHFGASNTPVTVIEEEHPQMSQSELAKLVAELQGRGHEIAFLPRTSGLATIVVRRKEGATELEGGADPRREGTARGR